MFARAAIECVAPEGQRQVVQVRVRVRDTVELLQPISAVYDRNIHLSARIACFLDVLATRIFVMDRAIPG